MARLTEKHWPQCYKRGSYAFFVLLSPAHFSNIRLRLIIHMNTKAITRINKEYGTPFYLFDINKLNEWCDELQSVFPSGITLCYAIKANPFLLKYFDRKLNHFEVCSPGEYEICRKYNIDSKKIIFSGVYKSKENLLRVFEEGFNGVITIESINHLRLLKEVISEKGIKEVYILPRLSSGNKFGMSKEDVLSVIDECKTSSVLNLKGIQYFSGTQKKRMSVIEKELSELDLFCAEIKEQKDITVNYIEYGPGMLYDYYDGTAGSRLEVAKEVASFIKPYLNKYSFTLEIGRHFAAPCGSYITKVVDIKSNNGKNYCLVDGGIHHVNYYGRMLGMNVPDVTHLKGDGTCVSADNCSTSEADRNNNACYNTSEKLYEVGGALCTVNDVLLRNHPVTDLEEGDLFVFNDTGAYSPSESSVLFLSRTMPKVFSIEGEDITMLRDSIESFEFNS